MTSPSRPPDGAGVWGRGRHGRGPQGLAWYETIYELIDMRSFSNLWFWIVLAVMWSSASHFVLGVPWDMVMRARRRGGQTAADVDTLARIKAARLVYILDEAGLFLTGFVMALLSGLGVLGFVYGIEFCQAVFLLGAPMAVVGALSMRAARAVIAGGLAGEALWLQLRRHRRAVQAIGMVAIFFTALWGMWQNLTSNVLGL